MIRILLSARLVERPWIFFDLHLPCGHWVIADALQSVAVKKQFGTVFTITERGQKLLVARQTGCNRETVSKYWNE